MQNRSAERAQAYLAELRSKANVSVTLPQPRNDVPIPADARVLGPSKAPVTIVEFSDYLCPFCQKAQTVVDEVLKRNEGKVRFVHRRLPARTAAVDGGRAGGAVRGRPGKFWDYRRNLLEAPGDWTDDDLLRRTASLGLDRSALQSCLASDRHDKAILESSQDWHQAPASSPRRRSSSTDAGCAGPGTPPSSRRSSTPSSRPGADPEGGPLSDRSFRLTPQPLDPQ